jgi:hypothetical protein
MLRFLKSYFTRPTPPEEPAVPNKVEAPEPAPVAQPQCGCGRSASGFCVGLHKLTAEEWATHSDNPNKSSAEVKTEPVKKKAAAKKSAAPKKPAAIKAAPKKKKTEPK